MTSTWDEGDLSEFASFSTRPRGLESAPAVRCSLKGCGQQACLPIERYHGLCSDHFRFLFCIPDETTGEAKGPGLETEDLAMEIVTNGLPSLQRGYNIHSVHGLTACLGHALEANKTDPSWDLALARYDEKADPALVLKFLCLTLYNSSTASLRCTCPLHPCPVFSLRVFYGTELLSNAITPLLMADVLSTRCDAIKTLWRLFQLFHNLPVCQRYSTLEIPTKRNLGPIGHYIGVACTIGIETGLINALLELATGKFTIGQENVAERGSLEQEQKLALLSRAHQLDSPRGKLNGNASPKGVTMQGEFVDLFAHEIINPIILPSIFQCLYALPLTARAEVAKNVYGGLAGKPHTAECMLLSDRWQVWILQLVSDIQLSHLNKEEGDESLLRKQGHTPALRQAATDVVSYCVGFLSLLHFYAFHRWIGPRFANAVAQTLRVIQCFDSGWNMQSLAFVRRFFSAFLDKLLKDSVSIANDVLFAKSNLLRLLVFLIQFVFFTPLTTNSSEPTETISRSYTVVNNKQKKVASNELMLPELIGAKFRTAMYGLDNDDPCVLNLNWDGTQMWASGFAGLVSLHWTAAGMMDVDLLEKMYLLIQKTGLHKVDVTKDGDLFPEDLSVLRALASGHLLLSRILIIMKAAVAEGKDSLGGVPAFVGTATTKLTELFQSKDFVDTIGQYRNIASGNQTSKAYVLMESALTRVKSKPKEFWFQVTPEELIFSATGKSSKSPHSVRLDQILIHDVEAPEGSRNMNRAKQSQGWFPTFNVISPDKLVPQVREYYSKHPFAIHIATPRSSFVVFASSTQMKERWLVVLSQAQSSLRTVKGKIGGGLFGLDPDLYQTTWGGRSAEGVEEETHLSDIHVRFHACVAPMLVQADGITKCTRCPTKFGLLSRKKHCYCCGNVFCSNCTQEEWVLPNFDPVIPQKVCKSCVRELQKIQHQKTVHMAKMIKARSARIDAIKADFLKKTQLEEQARRQLQTRLEEQARLEQQTIVASLTELDLDLASSGSGSISFVSDQPSPADRAITPPLPQSSVPNTPIRPRDSSRLLPFWRDRGDKKG